MRQLAIEKLEAKAEELRPQWAWTKAVLEAEYQMLHQYDRVEPRPAKVPDELAAEIERIEQRLAEFEDTDGDAWTDELAAEMAQLEEHRAEIDETIESLAVYSKKDRKSAGCIVTIGDDGRFERHQGLVEPSAAQATPMSLIPTPTGMRTIRSIRLQRRLTAERRVPPPLFEQAIRKECGFSQSLVDDLKAHRHQITRAYMAGNFEVAFDLALYALATDLFDRFHYHEKSLDLRAIEATPRSSLNDLSGTPADRLIEAQRAALATRLAEIAAGRRLRGPCRPAARSEAPPLRLVHRLCLKPQLAIEDNADRALETAAHRLAIPFDDLWRPTAANYWGRAARSTASGSAGKSSASAGRAIMPTTRSLSSPPRLKPHSIPRRARPASVSIRPRGTVPPPGYRRAWPIAVLTRIPKRTAPTTPASTTGNPKPGIPIPHRPISPPS